MLFLMKVDSSINITNRFRMWQIVRSINDIVQYYEIDESVFLYVTDSTDNDTREVDGTVIVITGECFRCRYLNDIVILLKREILDYDNKEIRRIIFHELMHAEQFAKNELVPKMHLMKYEWKGKMMKEFYKKDKMDELTIDEYRALPWEAEARFAEVSMEQRYKRDRSVRGRVNRWLDDVYADSSRLMQMIVGALT